MIRQQEKMSFEKKRFRNETHKDKKRKRNKKTIARSVAQESSKSSSKIISNDFSLSFAKTITISNRTLSSIQYSNNRARQLSNELKEVHQRY